MRSGKDGVFRIPGTAKDIAAEVGLTHEAFYRALAALEKSRCIARTPGTIRLTSSQD